MGLIYENRIDTEFRNKVIEVSQKLNVNPNWLMAIMKFESGLNPRAVNPNGGATGLIQFMPKTAKALGTTTEELKRMSAVEQLDYVYKYYRPYKHKIKSFVDMYLVTFMPISVGKPADWIFQTKRLTAEMIAKVNPIFDINRDGVLTVAEVEEILLKKLPSEWKSYFKTNGKEVKKKFCW